MSYAPPQSKQDIKCQNLAGQCHSALYHKPLCDDYYQQCMFDSNNYQTQEEEYTTEFRAAKQASSSRASKPYTIGGQAWYVWLITILLIAMIGGGVVYSIYSRRRMQK